MGRINRLDEHLSNMIAAGEVVERPMGIVKELVENSIDAKATHIEIQIVQGGIECITIIDDGIGMDAQDATLAFERHATSKIKETDDLWNIHTLGFRGEALPSIASVAAVNLKTNDGTDSTEVEIKYGKLMKAEPVGTPRGTQIEIHNLFQKTPARFKHLKTPPYEFSLISDVVQKFALSHPEIAFSLSHDGRTVFKTNGSGQLLEVLMQIYGRDVVKSAIEINACDHDYHVSGYAIQPSFNRATKYYMLLYVNERMIRSYRLQKAILDAYGPYMFKDRYPIVVLNIKMDAQLVDVNVHPSKWEIRLSKEKQLEKLIYETLDSALKNHLEVSRTTPKHEKEKVEIQELSFEYEKDKDAVKLHQEVNESFKKGAEIPKLDLEEIRRQIEKPVPEIYEEKPKELKPQFVNEKESMYDAKITNETNTLQIIDKNIEKTLISLGENDISQSLNTEEIKQEDVKIIQKPIESDQKYSNNGIGEIKRAVNNSFPQMQVIGQMHGCYILAQGDEGLYIIDQHAAQERYHYEQLNSMLISGNMDMQPLLFPVSIETSMAAVTQIQELNELLKNVGIELEVFGNNSLVCRQLPVWMNEVDEKAFIQDMIDIWLQDREVSIEKLRKDAVASMACHSSIRFNRNLTMEEMNRVVDDLRRCEQPFHCPHGRPTFICMTNKQLEKDFKRIV